MPASYSYDLRTKVIKALDDGMSQTQVSRLFQISRNTINLWLKRRKETGDYRAKFGYQQGYNPKIQDARKIPGICSDSGQSNSKRNGRSLAGKY